MVGFNLRSRFRLSLFLFLFLSSSLALACPPDSPFTGKRFKLVNVEGRSPAIKHEVNGAVTVDSACSFSVRNMTLIPTGNGVYWYGITADDPQMIDPSPRIVSGAVGSYNGQTAKFTLSPEYSLSNFTILMLYSEGDHRAYGAFALTGNLTSTFGGGDKDRIVLDPNDDIYQNQGLNIWPRWTIVMAMGLILCVYVG